MPFDGSPDKNTTLPQVIIDLMAARHYLDTYGWCKETLRQGEKRCLMGAIYEVTDSYTKRPDHPNALRATYAIRTLEQQIKKTTGHPTVYCFNDHLNRRYADIQNILDLTVKNEMEKASV